MKEIRNCSLQNDGVSSFFLFIAQACRRKCPANVYFNKFNFTTEVKKVKMYSKGGASCKTKNIKS